MTVSGIETQQSSPVQFSDSQARRHITSIQPEFTGLDKSDNQEESKRGAPIQDHVSLSKEAQELAASNSQISKNNTFQQSPSPFDQ